MNFIQKIITFFLFLIISSQAFAQKVEDIFLDINSDYPYLQELQFLYDKGYILENSSNKFFPQSSITREEFVGLLMETNCSKCISPYTDIHLLSTLKDKNVYNDVNNNSPYYYCIAQADEGNYIQGYDSGTSCQNNTQTQGKPFCPQNLITYEEALAIIMRTGNILSQQNAEKIINEIKQGKEYPNIGKDVFPKNPDGSVNTFYPYFYTAQGYSISEYDTAGNLKNFQLFNKDQQYFFPQSFITKQKMLQLAVFSAKNNKCSEENFQNNGNIFIKNAQCVEGKDCNIPANFILGNDVDFQGEYNGTCPLGVDETNISWSIFHKQTLTHKIYSGKYLDNIEFSQDGDYIINIYMKDNCGNTVKNSQNFSIRNSQKEVFDGYLNKTIESESLGVDFSLKIDGNTGPYNYLWDFGDGNTSGEQNPNYTYKTDGIYDVKVIVTDKNGTKKTFSTSINFGKKIIPHISHTQTQLGNKNVYDFIAPGNAGKNYFWDFGDGTTSSQQNPRHVYDTKGNYNVKLIKENQDGSIQEFIYTVNPGEESLQLEVHQNSENFSYNFESKNNQENGPYSYKWYFGDGTTSNIKNPRHKFPQEGNYTVQLTRTDKNGISSTQNMTVGVEKQNLITDIVTKKTENGENNYSFEGIIISGTGPFIYNWDLGDGNTKNGKNITHNYQFPGEYNVILNVVDSKGNTSTVYSKIYIQSNNTNFNTLIKTSSTQGNAPLKVDFQGVVFGNSQNNYAYEWNFGNSKTTTGKNTSHTFYEPGNYQVTLSVTDQSGKQVEKNVIIQVKQTTQVNIQSIDSDNDGIDDSFDSCPDIYGDAVNSGCPIYETTCSSDEDCPSGSNCQNFGKLKKCVIQTQNTNCDYFGGSFISGNVVCDTCPCEKKLDFKAGLRSCDVIFPAIVSPDGTQIFSKGKYFQIK